MLGDLAGMLGVLLGTLMAVIFPALQGAVVFATAYLGLRLLKVSHWFGKLVAMTVSYIAWTAFTITAYMAGGGEGGLMDGGLLVLGLCFTALVSSFVYLLAWILLGKRKEREAGEQVMIEPGS